MGQNYSQDAQRDRRAPKKYTHRSYNAPLDKTGKDDPEYFMHNYSTSPYRSRRNSGLIIANGNSQTGSPSKKRTDDESSEISTSSRRSERDSSRESRPRGVTPERNSGRNSPSNKIHNGKTPSTGTQKQTASKHPVRIAPLVERKRAVQQPTKPSVVSNQKIEQSRNIIIRPPQTVSRGKPSEDQKVRKNTEETMKGEKNRSVADKTKVDKTKLNELKRGHSQEKLTVLSNRRGSQEKLSGESRQKFLQKQQRSASVENILGNAGRKTIVEIPLEQKSRKHSEGDLLEVQSKAEMKQVAVVNKSEKRFSLGPTSFYRGAGVEMAEYVTHDSFPKPTTEKDVVDGVAPESHQKLLKLKEESNVEESPRNKNTKKDPPTILKNSTAHIKMSPSKNEKQKTKSVPKKVTIVDDLETQRRESSESAESDKVQIQNFEGSPVRRDAPTVVPPPASLPTPSKQVDLPDDNDSQTQDNDSVLTAGFEKVMVAVGDFEATQPGTISLSIGDQIEIIRDPGWCRARNTRTGQIGFIPKTLVSKDEWFFGTMEEEEAEHCLMWSCNPRGTFLVRCDPDLPGRYIISVKDIIDASDKGSGDDDFVVRHISVIRLTSGRVALEEDIDAKRFSSLQRLVRHYMKNPLFDDLQLEVGCEKLDRKEKPKEIVVEEKIEENEDETNEDQCDNEEEKRDDVCDIREIRRRLGIPNENGDSSDEEEEVTAVDRWEIKEDDIEFMYKVDEGLFGEVWFGRWQGLDVAIKALTSKYASEQSFDEEVSIMKLLKHENIVQLFGVCSHGDYFLVVEEYMSKGSLLQYLKDEKDDISLRHLVSIASQVGNGMMYLEEKSIIHRDLAARNILLNENLGAKICDFGLAKVLTDGQYEGQLGDKFPLRWTAPEALEYGKYSKKSDVWSFGVFLMELFTFGEPPYNDMSATEVSDRVKKGYRMKRPKEHFVPKPVYQLMLSCWEADPSKRPSFGYIAAYLPHMKISAKQMQYISGSTEV